MPLEAAKQLATELNAKYTRSNRRAVVMVQSKGKKTLGYGIQFRIPGDVTPTIDGPYTFTVLENQNA
jgi:hypothetical protein